MEHLSVVFPLDLSLPQSLHGFRSLEFGALAGVRGFRLIVWGSLLGFRGLKGQSLGFRLSFGAASFGT